MKKALVTIATTVEDLEALPDDTIIIVLPYPTLWYKVGENHWSDGADWNQSQHCLPAIIVEGEVFSGDIND